MWLNLVKKIGRRLAIILITLVTGFIASALAGAFIAAGGNLFNPLTTLAYLLTAYLFSYFYGSTKNQMFGWCLFALILSFSVNFITGSILLVLLPPVLKKLKLI